MKHLACFFIRVYRKLLSPLKPSCCRYTPTCSAYALEAFTVRGFFVGGYLTLRRICRCNPFGGFGYDPVPYGTPWKRYHLFNKKRENALATGEKTGVTFTVVTVEKKEKRKVATLLLWDGTLTENNELD